MEKIQFEKILKDKKWERYDCGEGYVTPHCYYIPKGSAIRTDLCGEWDFIFSEDIRKLDITAKPEKIKVPSCWQIEGYDKHQYLNTRYPIPFRPPYVPEANPASLYRKTVKLESKSGTRTYITIAGADSFYILLINGKQAGCHMISHIGAEFDITDYVISGCNIIEILLCKWSTGTYFECQDKFRMSGIFREVYITEREDGHIADYFIRADFDKSYKTADINITFSGGGSLDKSVDLFYKGNLVASAVTPNGSVKLVIDKPVLWNAEKPALYDIRIECGGEIIEDVYALCDVGIDNGVLKLNGQKIKLRGVNRHESYYDSGYVTDNDKMYRDLTLMKRFNINAVRTSHYPDTPEFYRMCDKLGFYVINEADIETHGANELGEGYAFDTLTDDLTYGSIIKGRVLSMFQRDKNRGSVIMWSLGNESGWGRCLINAANLLKSLDGRPVHYESVYGKPENVSNNSMLDVWSRMYPSTVEIEKYLKKPANNRPLILCEYTHAMGNSCGDVFDYENLFESNDILAGGFVWEWNDHAAKGDYKGYKDVPLYGGDFGERLHDGNFCADGLLSHERIPHTSLYEVKQAYRPLKVVRGAGWRLTNRTSFSDASEYIIKITRNFSDGTEKVTELSSCAGPFQTVEIFPEIESDAVSVKFEYVPRNKILPENHSAGFDFFELKPFESFRGFLPVKPEIDFYGGEYKVKTSACEYSINDRGMFSGIKVCGREILESAGELNIMRAPVDNDRNVIHEWRRPGICDAEFFADGIIADGGKIKVLFSARAAALPDIMRGELVYTFSDCGVNIAVKADVREAVGFLPRFGINFYLDKAFDNVEYYGYGGGESYIDKHHYCEKKFNRFKVSEALCPYLKPQEYGSHYGTDYIKIGDGERDIIIQSKNGMSFSGLPYSMRQLSGKKYYFELNKENRTVLSVDYKMSGLGSNSCGPALDKKYQLKEKKIIFSADMFFEKTI